MIIFRNLMLYLLMIAQLLILRISNLMKDVIKAFESLKMHILIIVFHAFLTIRRFLMFKYKLFLTYVLKVMQQLLSFLIYLI